MSDMQVGAGSSTGQTAVLPGATLLKARLEQGLEVSEVATKLNLTESAVSSLEADRYEDLPGVAFVRGYIRAYAKLLGLNPDQLASQYTQTTTTGSVRPLPVLTPGRRRGRSRFMLIGLAIFVVVLAVAAYMALVEQGSKRLSSQDETEPLLSRVEVERVDGTLLVQSLDDLDARTADMPVAEIGLDNLTEQEPVAETEQQTSSAEPQTEPAATVEEATPTAQETEQSVVEVEVGQLKLVFAEQCWVRVTDASGKELASGLKPAGSELSLDGDAPFELHLGNAPGLRIFFKGQEVDFKDSIRGNVARLKLG